MAPPPLLETAIKAKVIEEMRRRGMVRVGEALTTEFFIDSRRFRADLAVFGERMVGIEVKSSSDTLNRLPSQLESYIKHFDDVIVVVAPRHLEITLRLAPINVAVWTIGPKGGVRQLRPLGKAQRTLERRSLLNLLTIGDLRRLQATYSLPRNGTRRKHLEFTTLALDHECLRTEVVYALQMRYRTTSEAFWTEVGIRPIEQQHLVALSRFADRRRDSILSARRAEAFWDTWNLNAGACLSQSPEL